MDLSRSPTKECRTQFRTAHEHYCHRRYGEANAAGLMALESTLKVICDRRGWKFSGKDTASPLIDIVFKEGLIPDYLQSQFSGLRAVLTKERRPDDQEPGGRPWCRREAPRGAQALGVLHPPPDRGSDPLPGRGGGSGPVELCPII